jgi:hypothetical protein
MGRNRYTSRTPKITVSMRTVICKPADREPAIARNPAILSRKDKWKILYKLINPPRKAPLASAFAGVKNQLNPKVSR